jgi:nucleotide-binding universal stress UspA family protein
VGRPARRAAADPWRADPCLRTGSWWATTRAHRQIEPLPGRSTRRHGAAIDLVYALTFPAYAPAIYAFCSVVIVRADRLGDRPVVLGLDESTHAVEAARFAFGQAAARGVELQAVHAWMPPVDPWIGNRFPDREEAATAELVWAEKQLSRWRAEFPAVSVRLRSEIGHPYKLLTATAGQAQLTVVGARGRGGFRDLRLGSVTRHLVHHGTGTTAVIR